MKGIKLNNITSLLGLIPILLLTCFTTLTAQSLRVSPQKVEVGQYETFELVYSVDNGDLKNFQAPDLSNFHIMGGPNHSQSMQFVNGKMSRQVSLSYILQPKSSGNFTIPPATAQVNGKSSRSGKVTVSVSAGGIKPKAPSTRSGAASPSPGGNQSVPNGNKTITLDEGIFLQVMIDTNQVYQGQQLSITYRLYTAVDISDYNITGVPSLTGFWVQDVTPDRMQARGREVIDDIAFTTYDLKEYALFPQRSGRLEIDPMEVNIVARIPNKSNPRSFFQTYQSVRVDRISEPVAITVLPLPEEGKPDDFNGAVGSFNMTANIDKRQVKAGESVKLTVRVTGQGNIKLLEPPKVVFPKDCDHFEPIIRDDVFDRNKIVRGTKIFEYTMIPRIAAKFQNPQITFSFFNPETGQYKTLKGPQLGLNVLKGDGRPVDPSDVNESVLQPMKESIKLHQKGGSFFTSPVFWTLMGLPFLAFPVFLLFHQRREAELADVVSYKRKRANKVAVQKLAEAKNLMQAGDKKGFYDEVIRTIWGYLGDRLNIPIGELDKDNIRSILQQNYVPDNFIDKLLDTISYCEMALFAPVKDADNLQGTYDTTLSLLADIEESLASPPVQETPEVALELKSWLLIALLSMPLMAHATDVTTQMKQANDYAINNKQQQAIDLFENILKEGYESAALYYNLGNCYYQLKQPAPAVLNYERALLLKPKDKATLINLSLTKEELIEKKVASYPQIFYKRWWIWVVNTFSSGIWAILAIVEVWIALALAVLFVRRKESGGKKKAFYGAVASLFFAVLFTLFAWNKYTLEYNDPQAVVFTENTAFKNGPADNSKDLSLLAPGTKVKILENVDQWSKVRLSDGQEGWVKVDNVEKI